MIDMCGVCDVQHMRLSGGRSWDGPFCAFRYQASRNQILCRIVGGWAAKLQVLRNAGAGAGAGSGCMACDGS